MNADEVRIMRHELPSPPCPKCEMQMRLRTAKVGHFKGQKFWGCSQFPLCNGIVQIGVVPSGTRQRMVMANPFYSDRMEPALQLPQGRTLRARYDALLEKSLLNLHEELKVA